MRYLCRTSMIEGLIVYLNNYELAEWNYKCLHHEAAFDLGNNIQ